MCGYVVQHLHDDRAVLVVDETGDVKLRAALEERGTGYVLAVACSHQVTTGAGKFHADILADRTPERAWPARRTRP